SREGRHEESGLRVQTGSGSARVVKERSRGGPDLLLLMSDGVGSGTDFYRGEEGALAAARFCELAVEVVRRLKPVPDLVLCVDWPSALVPCMIADQRLPLTTALLLVDPRNIGRVSSGTFRNVGVSQHWFSPETGEFFGSFSFLKAGIAACDRLLATGMRHAEELTSHAAEGLSPFLQRHKGKLRALPFLLPPPPSPLTARAYKSTMETLFGSRGQSTGAQAGAPLLLVPAVEEADSAIVAQATLLLAQEGWNVLLQPVPGASSRLRSELLAIEDPSGGVALVQAGGPLPYAVADVVLFTSRTSRDAGSLLRALSHGCLPVAHRHAPWDEALHGVLSFATTIPRLLFDNAHLEGLLFVLRDAGRWVTSGPRRKELRKAAEEAFEETFAFF
ncbi:MAG: glycogen/starch synthase, partial [Verrucomicrobiia bacterium]